MSFCLVTSVFISMSLDGVHITSFSRIIHVNTSITIKVLGEISFRVMEENWQHLKDTLAFSSLLVCYNQNRVLLTRDLLPNISLVVGQSSVYISLALRVRDIATSRLTSNQ